MQSSHHTRPAVSKAKRTLIGTASITLWMLTIQPVSAKVPLDYHAFGRWRTIEQAKISHDGHWLVYALTASTDDGELVARNLDNGREYREPRGDDPQISDDSRYVAYAIAPKKADVIAAERAKKKPKDQPKPGFGLLDLSNGQTQTLEKIQSFSFPKHSSKVVAALAAPADPDDADKGSDLTVLTNGGKAAKFTIHRVVSYALSQDGRWVAYAMAAAPEPPKPSASGKKCTCGKKEKVTKAAPQAVGVFARATSDGKTVTLLNGKGRFASLTFSNDSDSLVFLADSKTKPDTAASYTLYLWNGQGTPLVLARPGKDGVPAAYAPSSAAPMTFSKDGQRLYLGTAPVPTPTPRGTPEPINVELWHWKDRKLQAQQKFESKNPPTFAAEVQLAEKRFVQLASENVSQVNHTDNAHWALGLSDVAYQAMTTWDDRRYVDVYLVNLSTGEQRMVLQRALSGFGYPSLSPGGQYILSYDEAKALWYTMRTSDQHITWLNPNRSVKFNLEEEVHPVPEPAYGAAGWTEHDRSVLIYDRYDIWQADPATGAMQLVTSGYGRENHLDFRYEVLDSENRFEFPRVIPVIPTNTPILLSAVNERTKASGFYTISLHPAASAAAENASSATQEPKPLVMLDKRLTFVEKAKNANRLIFSEQRFDEYPDLWASDTTFAAPQRVTDANPQQSKYSWGTSKLIDFKNGRGETLQAILTTPDGFNPSHKYPMLVYIYERMSDGLHGYIQPEADTVINLTRYVSHGYVVLQPDITYQIGHTTAAAIDCVTSAVKQVIAMGFVDPQHIGVAGHSYGGYEVNALITHTDMFAAAEGGASDSNLISLYGGFWGYGNVQQGYYETGQGRLGTTPWDHPEVYIENSPLFFVQHSHTPYLRIQNDQDGAVPYGQGIEFFSALRRAGKEAYMFSFPGENHGLSNPKNMRFWNVHMDEFFDHFLVGTPEPDWMKDGIPYGKRGQRDVEPLYAPKPWPAD